MRRIVSIAGLTLLAACAQLPQADAPGTRTEYLFEGPSSGSGQRCVAGCEQHKASCRTVAEHGSQSNYKRCEDQAHDEYENCTMRTTSSAEKRQCYRKSCPVTPDFADCDAAYRGCFEGCGGVVWSRKVCDGPC